MARISKQLRSVTSAVEQTFEKGSVRDNVIDAINSVGKSLVSKHFPPKGRLKVGKRQA